MHIQIINRIVSGFCRKLLATCPFSRNCNALVPPQKTHVFPCNLLGHTGTIAAKIAGSQGNMMITINKTVLLTIHTYLKAILIEVSINKYKLIQ